MDGYVPSLCLTFIPCFHLISWIDLPTWTDSLLREEKRGANEPSRESTVGTPNYPNGLMTQGCGLDTFFVFCFFHLTKWGYEILEKHTLFRNDYSYPFPSSLLLHLFLCAAAPVTTTLPS